MSRTRRHFTVEQKAQIVRRHLADKEPVSKLADELQVTGRSRPALSDCGCRLLAI
ncbi:MAG: hypothetical protein WD278_09080 [Pirellulales bacterium]